jgi:ComF family protein
MNLNCLWTALISALYPKSCLICNKEVNDWLCINCRKKLKYLEFNRCPFCAKITKDGATCNNCKTDHYLDGLIASCYLDQNLKKIIYQFKYSQAREIAKILANILAKKIVESNFFDNKQNLMLAPIPLHPLDRARRGFNQSQLIAKQVSKNLNLNYQPSLIKKVRRTKDQTKLTKQEREKNIKEAFKLNKQIKTGKEKTILLIDDVFTTGATLEETAKTIKESCPKQKVWGAVVGKR